MPYRPEPPHRHGTRENTGILLVNLGTPAAPTTPEVARYLRQFLSDPRVVEIPAPLWALLLRTVIVPLRAKKSAEKYALVWTKEGSPLRVFSERQAKLLQGALGARGAQVRVEMAMRYGEPSVAAGLDRLQAQGATRILILPLYPQYSSATTGSMVDAVSRWCTGARRVPELRFVAHYHAHPAYIRALASQVKRFWEVHGRPDFNAPKPPRLVMSFHGVPKRTLLLGDPYHCHCHVTARLLREALGVEEALAPLSFQSRFGRAEWLKPYTAPLLADLAASGVGEIDILCPGFPADCLETLEEIAMEGKSVFLKAGGRNYRYIPCMNEAPEWADALASIALDHLAGWPTGRASAEDELALTRQKERAKALGAES